ncbi:MAG: rRNA pseudouridine synthase [Spirochaetaceae bacterium]|jgi:23S rRNA pseudouridine2605 synthase|nr:rRNA pseudouridine synthase [Spirochaetaceae bacterium]
MKTRHPVLNWEAEKNHSPSGEADNCGEKTSLRLQVFLAHAGIASRRESEGLIRAGRVTVNGVTVAGMGAKVQNGDIVCMDGVPVHPEQKFHYLAMNKPPGFICSSRDPQGRPLALELLPKAIAERLYNVGRLDYLSSGLVFFTNDGDFSFRLSHPGSEIEKEYLVESTAPVPDMAVEEFLAGVTIEGERYKALRIERMGRKNLRIVLMEGKNREIRRVFSHYHLHPRLLCRIRIGTVKLGDLPEGQTRPLLPDEIAALSVECQTARALRHDNRKEKT